MAIITPTQVDQFQGFATLIQWLNVTTAGADVGAGAYVGHLAFISGHAVLVSGAMTSIELQGSFDGVTWGTLGATALTLTTSGMTKAVPDAPLLIRPANPTGAAGVFNVFVLGKRFA